MSIYSQIVPHADAAPDRIALISETEGIRTFGEVAAGAERFAHALQHQLSLALGDRVAIWLPNRFEWFDAYIGAGAAGCGAVLANPDWSDREMSFVLGHSRARAIVCESALAERAVALARELPEQPVVIAVGPPVAGTCDFAALAAAAPLDARAARRDAPADFTASVSYTSGTTTGRPKAVAFRALEAARSIDYTEMFGLSPADRCLFVTPLFHGNANGAWQSALAYGASAVYQRRFSASTFWTLVDRYRPTYLFTLAPIVNILMGRAPDPVERAHSLRVLIVLGSGPNAAAIEERFGAPVIDWYGMIEAGSGTYTRLGDERRVGSAGRPFPNSPMCIVRDDLTRADAGEVGEVAFPLDRIGFSGYVDDDEATAAAVRDGYFLTGDLGYFDEDGYFFFVDRKKDIVRRGGMNVSSIEVETVLRAHPSVGDVAIVASPDPVLGERVAAFVVAVAPLELDDLRRFAAEALAPYKLPEVLRLIDELPRTGSGKVEKFRLREQLSEP